MSQLSGRTTIVVGASRGLGHGIVTALAEAGAPVVAVSRTEAQYPAGGTVHQEIADGADATVAARLLGDHDPDTVVLVAGAVPNMRTLSEHTWDTFAVNWETDVRLTFHWLRAVLTRPLRPGGRVIVVSSGAAIGGSPLSGGYAGAKATQKFITAYAQDEANRNGLDLTFTAVLPRFAPETAVGSAAVAAYAAQAGLPVDEFLGKQGPLLTPESAGAAVVELMGTDAGDVAPNYMLTGAGLKSLG